MRKDIGFYVAADIASVFDAYIRALSSEPFGRTCKEEPYHTISFPLNFSFEYNMCGGSCRIFLMPYENGTAVNIRFQTVQDDNVLYDKYIEDLHNLLAKSLLVAPVCVTYNTEDFLKPENRVTEPPIVEEAPIPEAEEDEAEVAPTAEGEATVTEEPAEPEIFEDVEETPVTEEVAEPEIFEEETAPATIPCCENCGAPIKENARFCTECGTVLASAKLCKNCNTPVDDNDLFCENCGERL